MSNYRHRSCKMHWKMPTRDRIGGCCRNRGRMAAMNFCPSALLICAIFVMEMGNCSSSRFLSDSDGSYWEQRSRLYKNMSQDLKEQGAAFLRNGETSQSLSIKDIFTLKDGVVTPILNPANPPVRANVLYLSPKYAEPISKAAMDIFNPYFEQAIWFQNSSLYHSTMFHASNQAEPVPATENEVEAEASSVKAVAEMLCPLKIVLDTVVLTPTGVLLGCWQVISGTDPFNIREKLKVALPNAPKKQLSNPVILHTTIARLLGPPKLPSGVNQNSSDLIDFFYERVDQLNRRIQGFQAAASELWYVEEQDVLALALNGRMKARRFRLHPLSIG